MNVAQTLTLDIALQVGAVDQTVEVSGAAPLVESSTSDLGTVVDQKQVADLPLSVNGNMRNPESFVFLAPGVTGDTANTEINGSQDRAKEVLVDGAQSTGPESGGTMLTYPPVEAIGEFKLQAANFSAEYGKTGGGFEIFTTKSGTNQYPRVGVRIPAQRQVRCARLHLADHAGQPAERIRRGLRRPGAPAEVQRPEPHVLLLRLRRLPLSRGRDQPGADAAQCGAAQRRFFGPDQRRACRWRSTIPTHRVPTARAASRAISFPGARIPANRFSKVSAAMLQLLPPANTNAGHRQLHGRRRDTSSTATSYTIKGDHAFSDRNRISLFFYISDENSVAPALIEGAMSPALNQQRPARWGRFNHDYQIHADHAEQFPRGLHARAAEVVARHLGPGAAAEDRADRRQSSGRHRAARAVQPTRIRTGAMRPRTRACR